MPDPSLFTDLAATDVPALLDLLPRADLYLQDEVELALHATLTRVWCRRGRRGQRAVEAPGTNRKCYGFGAVDWRDGWLDWEVAAGRQAVPFCAQLHRVVARSTARGRIAVVILDNLSIHTPRGSKLLREVRAELGERLVLVYTPPYDPDSNRIEWLWTALRRTVTHNHQRTTLEQIVADADTWVQDCTPEQILRQIGSPCVDEPVIAEELDHAA